MNGGEVEMKLAGIRPSTPNFWQTCRDVDQAEGAGDMAEHLDAIASLEPVRAAKQESLSLLGLRPGAQVLDVGCGTGQELLGLCELVGPSGRVVGLDNSRTLIAAAESRARHVAARVELVVGDAHELSFPDASFDAVRADRTLQHLAQPDQALAEMARVTRPGGRVVVTEGEWALESEALDPALTERVMAQLFGEGDRRGWIGHLLPVLFRMLGLTGLQLFSYAAEVGDADSLHRMLKLRWAVDRLAERGEISPQQGARWLAALDSAVKRGEARGRLALFHLAGRRPS